MKSDVLYHHLDEIHNTRSASIILPMLFEIYKPNSVLDVGAGLGTWLKVCIDLGVSEVLGIDGEYVDMSRVVIPHECFLRKDLTCLTYSEKRYDLTICLEVAEHLPPESAVQFVDFLTSSSDVILFSAAVPFQGGQGHINERPISYWVKLFEARKYTVYDFIRPQIWNNQSVDWWYRQNILIFSKRQDVFTDLPPCSFQANTMIHPELYTARMSRYKHLIDTLGLDVDKYDYLNYVVPQGKLAKIKLALRILLKLLKKMLTSK
jgi:hypothetical protein